MNARIVKATVKGQVTLPKSWRDQFRTDNYMMIVKKEKLEIKPVELTDIDEEVIFDADRDNDGKGIPFEEMIRILEKLQNE